jgi:hypothetical protein
MSKKIEQVIKNLSKKKNLRPADFNGEFDKTILLKSFQKN